MMTARTWATMALSSWAVALALVLSCREGCGFVIEGITFPPYFEMHQQITLQITGAGVLRQKKLFKVYAAALYLPQGVRPENALDDVPKRLELSCFGAMVGSAFGRSLAQHLEQSVMFYELPGLRQRLEQISAAFRDVKAGDRYALTYHPATGTELALNGKPLVVIQGADFAEAYFSIWLGKHPIDKDLKKRLFGKR